MTQTSSTKQRFFNVSITSLEQLEGELNRINDMPGWSIIDMIAAGEQIGLVYIDSNALFEEDAPTKPDSNERGN